MFKIDFIQNPPTVQDLKSLYESEAYQGLLIDFEKYSGHKLVSKEEGEVILMKTLNFIQRLYLVLNIPFEEVTLAFGRLKKDLLVFTTLCVDFFSKLENESDEELSEGESLGVARTFFLDKFCELYLLSAGNEERLLHYLETTRMPHAKEYIELISEFYEQIKTSSN